jgi:hypothetical protein
MKINLRYICQGMITIPEEKVPASIVSMSPVQAKAWADKIFNQLTKEELIAGINYMDPEEDTEIGAVELNTEFQQDEFSVQDDYTILAQTVEWAAFTAMNSHELMEGQP